MHHAESRNFLHFIGKRVKCFRIRTLMPIWETIYISEYIHQKPACSGAFSVRSIHKIRWFTTCCRWKQQRIDLRRKTTTPSCIMISIPSDVIEWIELLSNVCSVLRKMIKNNDPGQFNGFQELLQTIFKNSTSHMKSTLFYSWKTIYVRVYVSIPHVGVLL